MPQKTNLNISPYYDDFSVDKNFYRVLFKPGYPVQARELTTIQSILQNQIESFGSHIFKEGSMVIPGSVTYDDKYFSIQINFENFGIPVSLYLTELVGKIVKGQNTGITAIIQNYSLPPSEGVENITLYVKYIESSNTSEISQFEDGESLILQENLIYGNTTLNSGDVVASLIEKNAAAVGSSVGITKGIYFIRGTFVQVSDSTLVLDPYSNKTSYRVGLTITEEFVTPDDDSSLNDNSRGFSNFAAPGADRLKISTVLSKKDLDDFNDINFVEIIKVEEGRIKKLQDTSVYSIIRDYFARRTYDESGDYSLSQFKVNIQDSLSDRISNDGIYLPTQKTQDGNTPSDDLMCVKISPGKAYVRGYDLNFPDTTIIDVPKPRKTQDSPVSQISFEMGNLLRVYKVTGAPILDLSNSLNKIYLKNKLKDDSPISIGEAKVYTFNLTDAPYTGDTTLWDLYLFDIQTYTVLNVTENLSSSECPKSSFVRGLSSGATGYVVNTVSGSKDITLIQTSGSFMVGEAIIINENTSFNRTIRSFKAYTTEDIKSVSQDSSSLGGYSTFSANVMLDRSNPRNFNLGDKILIKTDGTVSIPARSGQNFLGIRSDAIIRYQIAGLSTETYNRVESVSLDGFSMKLQPITTSVKGVFVGNLPTSNYETTFKVGIANISGNNNASLFVPFNDRNISSVNLSDSDLVITKQLTGKSVSNGQLIINISDFSSLGISTAFFEAFDVERYTISYSDGTIEDLTSDQVVLQSGGSQVLFRGLIKTTASNVIVSATIRKSQLASKTKLFTRSQKLIVDKTSVGSASSITGLSTSPYYGLRVQDHQISLNVPDVVNVVAVYESLNQVAPTLDSLTFTSGYNLDTASVLGERIIGNDTGAIAQLVTRVNSTKVEFVYLNNKLFEVGENVLFEESKINANIQVIGKGSYLNVTNKYVLDKNQKNQYYDYSRIVRSKNSSSPSRQLLVIFNYYEILSNDSGDVITANSYTKDRFAKDVPILENNLRSTDTLDFRPRVKKFTSTTASPFDFSSREFDASSVVTVTPNESSRISYSYYLPRIDRIVLNKLGEFSVIQGNPSLKPKVPLNVEEAMDIATVYLPAYLYDPDNAKVTLVDNRRYTMRDIGKLEDRIENLEYVTSLSLLELDTKTLQIQDADGLSRFKTGFFVDDFKNNDLIEKNNSDVKCDIDFKNKELVTPVDFASMKAELALDTNINPLTADFSKNLQLLDPNVQKTGDLITLKYEEKGWITQQFASDYENVNPFNIVTYTGEVKLNPASDNWVRNIYIEITRTVTNAAVTVNKVVTRSRTGWWWGWPWFEKSWWNSPSGKFSESEDFPGSDDAFGSGEKLGVPFTGKTEGTTFDYVESVNTHTEPDPYLRSRNVEFRANGLKPFTRHYPFIDGNGSIDIIPKLIEIIMVSGTFQIGENVVVTLGERILGSFRLAQPNHKSGTYDNPDEIYNINPYLRDIGLPSSYSASTTILNVDTFSLAEESLLKYGGYIEKNAEIVGETSGAIAKVTDLRLITDDVGDLIGCFFIRDPNNNPVPLVRIKTGDRTFKLNSDSTNQSITTRTADQISEASAVYRGSGIIKTQVTTMVKVRIPPPPPPLPPPTSPTAPRRDPLAQSFTVDETGAFLTSVDVYFYSKDPVQNLYVELRTVELGLPTNQLVQDYARVTLRANQVKTSSDASVPTRITFPSPIHLEPNTEYALVFLAPTTNNYNMWVATMGKKTISSQNLPDAESVYITRQYLGGSLFKSQNGTIWTASQFQDLKFTLYKAKFISRTGEVVFYNPSITNGGPGITTDIPMALPSPANPVLPPNPIKTLPRKIRVGITTTVTMTTKFLPGRRVGWKKCYGYVERVGGPITSGTITVVNPGIGYSDGTYSNVDLYSISGRGRGAKGTVVVSSGVVQSVTVSAASTGSGYSVGDIVGISTTLMVKGRGATFSITNTGGIDTLFLDNVQGDKFEANTANQLYYIEDNGTQVSLANTSVIVASEVISPLYSGNIIEVKQYNHGHHGKSNKVKLGNIAPNTIPVLVTDSITQNSTSISVASTSEFTSFEGVSSSSGYVVVNNEVMEYTGIGVSSLTISRRGVNGTLKRKHENGSIARKYEICGFSLTKVNKIHSLHDTDDETKEVIEKETDIDKYYIVLEREPSRSTGETQQNFISQVICGGVPGIENPIASQNHQFNSIIPQFNIVTPGKSTTVSSQIRTISGTSVGGVESSYIDQGYQPVEINKSNFFTSPRLVASYINESEYLSSLPNNKSLSLRIRMNSEDENLSPVLDLQTSMFVLGRNKINSPISDYASDGRVNLIEGDPHTAIYISKKVELKQSATSLKVYVSAYRPPGTDFRVLYQLFKPDSSEVPQSFILFPGYDNIIDTGVGYDIIDPALNSGRPDIYVRPSKENEFLEYQFTIDNLEKFTGFAIKMVMSSTNEAYPVKFKDLRCIALA